MKKMTPRQQKIALILGLVSIGLAMLYFLVIRKKQNSQNPAELTPEANLVDLSDWVAQSPSQNHSSFDGDAIPATGEHAKQMQSDLNAIIIWLQKNPVQLKYYGVENLVIRAEKLKNWVPLNMDGVIGAKTKSLCKYVTGEEISSLNKIKKHAKGWVYYTTPSDGSGIVSSNKDEQSSQWVVLWGVPIDLTKLF